MLRNFFMGIFQRALDAVSRAILSPCDDAFDSVSPILPLLPDAPVKELPDDIPSPGTWCLNRGKHP